MGVDYYSCECCGEALYEEFTDHCGSCDKNLCVDCLVNTEDVGKDGRYTYPFHGEECDGIDPKYCPYCEGVEIDDADLLNFAIKLLGITKEDLIKQYQEE